MAADSPKPTGEREKALHCPRCDGRVALGSPALARETTSCGYKGYPALPSGNDGCRVTAQEALKAVLKEQVAPVLRSHGYKGSAPTWRRTSERGDVAVVNVQSSSFSSAAEVLCVINTAVAPRPWLDWSEVKFGRPVKSVKESDGLWRDRVHATDSRVTRGGEPWWGVTDTRSARMTADDMVEQLEATALPTLERLLRREEFVRTVREGDLGFAKSSSLPTFFDWALLTLLADEPPSEEFKALLAKVATSPEERTADAARRLTAWARDHQQARTN